jgi:hypothetical protein
LLLQTSERATIVQLCQAIHKHAKEASEAFYLELRRRNYVTPTSFLELIGMFQKILVVKRSRNRQLKNRYAVGLEKLEGSAADVTKMQDELTALQPELVKTVGEVGELMAKIAKEKREVVEPKAEVCLHLSSEAEIDVDHTGIHSWQLLVARMWPSSVTIYVEIRSLSHFCELPCEGDEHLGKIGRVLWCLRMAPFLHVYYLFI